MALRIAKKKQQQHRIIHNTEAMHALNLDTRITNRKQPKGRHSGKTTQSQTSLPTWQQFFAAPAGRHLQYLVKLTVTEFLKN